MNRFKHNFILIAIFLTACTDGQKKDDITIRGPQTPNQGATESWGQWLDARFYDASGRSILLAASDLTTGTPPGSIDSTYAVTNLPIGLFSAGIKSTADGAVAPMPYLAFTMDKDATASVRYIKSVSGKNMQSIAVIPRECPAALQGPGERQGGDDQKTNIPLTSLCIPLINQMVPEYLKPTDALGVYAHTFVVSIKKPGSETAKTLTTRLSINVLIPDSRLSIGASEELKALRMKDRLLMTSSDLSGAPRRDFPAAVITSELAPGVATKWILRFTDLKMRLEEEVFFELPVAPGTTRLRPNVSRGQSFLKRTTSIDSFKNFRLRLADQYNPSQIIDILPSGVTTGEIAITDANGPLRLIVMPDFKSDQATMSMAQYVKPYYPVFCKDQAQIFKPEEWRQAAMNIPGYVACEARTRTKIASTADAVARGITSPVETFFGSFSYKSMLGQSLGGMSGVLSLRLTISGAMTASVSDPLAPNRSVKVGETTFSFSYNLPSALADMQDVVRGQGVPSGLDVIHAAIISKGVLDPPPQADGRAPFPFLGEWSSNVFF